MIRRAKILEVGDFDGHSGMLLRFLDGREVVFPLEHDEVKRFASALYDDVQIRIGLVRTGSSPPRVDK